MKLLLTAFDPFDGETVNPAQEAVQKMPDSIGEIMVIRQEIPTSFARSGAVLEKALAEHRPDFVLCVGQAGGRSGITIERIGINVDDAARPDNDGYAPRDLPIIPGAPAAYFATVPVKKMVQAVRTSGIPCAVSDSAGTFVCNHVLYTLLHLQSTLYPGTMGGFVHVPFALQQAVLHPGAPSMAIETMVQALTAAIRALV